MDRMLNITDEMLQLVDEAAKRLRSNSQTLVAGALWRLLDAAGLLQREIHSVWGKGECGPMVHAAFDGTGRGFVLRDENSILASSSEPLVTVRAFVNLDDGLYVEVDPLHPAVWARNATSVEIQQSDEAGVEGWIETQISKALYDRARRTLVHQSDRSCDEGAD